MPRERRLVQGPEPMIGDFVATCLGAEERTAKSGSQCVVWSFQVDALRLDRWTVKRRIETGETAGALGLGRRFRLSDAAGKRCIVSVSWDGMYHSIERCRSLGSGGPL